MKWTEYKSIADKNAHREGRPREGQELSAAPGGYRWAVMPGGKYALVHRGLDRAGNVRLWSLEGENR